MSKNSTTRVEVAKKVEANSPALDKQALKERQAIADKLNKLDPIDRGHKIRFSTYRIYDHATGTLRPKDIEDDYAPYAEYCALKAQWEADYWMAQSKWARGPHTQSSEDKIQRSLMNVVKMIKEFKAKGGSAADVQKFLTELAEQAK